MIKAYKARLAAVGRPFINLMLSDTLTLLSMMVGQVALPWWIAHEGGARDLALYSVTTAIVTFVAMPLLSPFGDRYQKRSLIMVGLLAYALDAVAVATLASAHRYQIHLIILLETGGVIANSLIMPAMSSIATELVRADKLTGALGLQKSAQSAGRLIGPVLSGAALAMFNTATALWLHAALLLLSVFWAARIPLLSMENKAKPQPDVHWLRELLAGFRANWAIPLERGWLSVNFAAWLFAAPAIGMLVPLKIKRLGLSGAWLGACEASLSLGMLLGAVGCSGWVIARCGRFLTRVGGGVVMGLGLAMVGLSSYPYLLVLAFCLCGIANSCIVLVGMTHRMLARPDAFRSRMTAASISVTQIAGSAGPALAGMALLHFSLDTVYCSFGVLSALCACLFFTIPGFRAFMTLDHDAVNNWYGRNFPNAFRER
jgi:MFS family permease